MLSEEFFNFFEMKHEPLLGNFWIPINKKSDIWVPLEKFIQNLEISKKMTYI